jgi:hypothetical protein
MEIIKHTDLARTEEPGARADIDELEIEAHVGPIGRIRLRGRAGKQSPLQSAMATGTLAAAGCISAGTISAIGAPAWVAVCSLPLPYVFHLHKEYLSRRRQRS